MARYSDTLRDQNEAPIAGALVAVTNQSGAAAVLTDDDDNPLDNPLTTDIYGGYYFNTGAGYYDLKFYYGARLVQENFGVPVGLDPTPSDGGLLNTVYPQDLPSWDPDNPTEAVQDAFSSGAKVLGVPGYTYTLNADVEYAVDGQELEGGIWAFDGACGFVVPEGLVGCAARGITINAPDHTGTAFTNYGSRTTLRDVRCVTVNNFLYAEKTNTLTVDNVWMQAQGRAFHLYGPTGGRDDVITLMNVIIGHPAASTNEALLIDGLVNTVDLVNFRSNAGGVAGGAGVKIQNTTGNPSNVPGIIRMFNVQVEDSTTHGINVAATNTSDVDVIGCYALRCAGDGLHVAATVNTGEVRVTGGKFRGNTGYGINNLGGPLYYAGNSDLADNDLGEKNGNLYTEPFDIRFGDGTRGINTDGSGNIVIFGDENDYQTYDAASNVWRWYVGGTQRLGVNATGAEVTGNLGVNFTPSSSSSVAYAGPTTMPGTVSNTGASNGDLTFAGLGGVSIREYLLVGSLVQVGAQSCKVLLIVDDTHVTTEPFTLAITNSAWTSPRVNPANPQERLTYAGQRLLRETPTDENTQNALQVYSESRTFANGTTALSGPFFYRFVRNIATGSGALTQSMDVIDLQPARTTAGVVGGSCQLLTIGAGPSNTANWSAPVVPNLIPSAQGLSAHSSTGSAGVTIAKMALGTMIVDHNSGIYTQHFGHVCVAQQVVTGQGSIGTYLHNMLYKRNAGGTDGPSKYVGFGISTTLWAEPSTEKAIWVEPAMESYFGGAVEIVGRTTFGAPANLKGYTVATLPAGTQGDTAYVTDANAPVFGTAVVGGGAVIVPVFKNATTWIAA